MKIYHVSDYHNGWFIGNFDPTILKREDFEVGYKKHKIGEQYDIHYHKETIEINLLTKGKMIIQDKTLNAGDIFVIYPYEISDPIFIEDCEVLVVRVPSVSKDKYLSLIHI